jgi:integrase
MPIILSFVYLGMAKIGFRLKSDTNKAVSIYVNFRPPNTKMLEARTGLSIHPSDWSKQKQRSKGKDPSHYQINNTLNNLSSFLDAQINITLSEGFAIDKGWLLKSINKFFNRIEHKDPMYVLNFLDTHINKLLKDHESGVGLKLTTIKGYKTFLKILTDYEKAIEAPIRFDQMDKNFFNDFYDWLLNERAYKPNNVNRHVTRLKTICGEAASMEVKVNPSYSLYKLKRVHEKQHINIITEKEFEQIKTYMPKNSSLINARKWLLIGLCIGQRVSDLLKITNSSLRIKGEQIVYVDITQQKGGKSITVPIKDDYVIDIIQNEFPHKISDQKFNNYLKDVCKESGIDSETQGYIKNRSNRHELMTGPKWMFLSSHDLRRSFATNHFHKGVPVPLLMQITGHKRESTFFKYIGHKFTKDEHAKAFLNYL